MSTSKKLFQMDNICRSLGEGITSETNGSLSEIKYDLFGFDIKEFICLNWMIVNIFTNKT